MTPEQENNLAISKQAFELLQNSLPDNYVATIREYIYDAHEWGLGIETMIDVILENEIEITSEQKKAIVHAAAAMEIERHQRKIKIIK